MLKLRENNELGQLNYSFLVLRGEEVNPMATMMMTITIGGQEALLSLVTSRQITCLPRVIAS